MLAVFICRGLFSLSSRLTFLIPCLQILKNSRKGNYNIPRKAKLITINPMYLILSSFQCSLQAELNYQSRSLVAWFDADQSLQEWMGNALPSYPSSVGTWEPLLSLVTTQSHIISDIKPAPVPHASHWVRIFTFMWVSWTQWIIVISVTIGALAYHTHKGTPQETAR